MELVVYFLSEDIRILIESVLREYYVLFTKIGN